MPVIPHSFASCIVLMTTMRFS